MPQGSARLLTKPRFPRGDPQPRAPPRPLPPPPPSPQDRPSHGAWARAAPLQEAEPLGVGPAGRRVPRGDSTPTQKPLEGAAAAPHGDRRRAAPLPACGHFRLRPLPPSGVGARAASGGAGMAGAARPGPTCLLLGATGVGKSLLGKRLRNIRASWGSRGRGGGVPHAASGLSLTHRHSCAPGTGPRSWANPRPRCPRWART